jgi:S1-C subfamily serine protease
VITARHVIAGAERITLIRIDGTRFRATVVAKDAANDLAVIAIDDTQGLPPGIPLAAQQPSAGERVFTIGYPHPDVLGNRPKVSEGIVGAVTGIGDDPRILQVSAPVQGGNSGGPLVNSKGEVIGVVTSKIDAMRIFNATGDLPENVGYAVKVAYLRPLLDSVAAGRKDSTPVLPSHEASLAELTKRVEGSILMIVCE